MGMVFGSLEVEGMMSFDIGSNLTINEISNIMETMMICMVIWALLN